jgi:hypothetical protein
LTDDWIDCLVKNLLQLAECRPLFLIVLPAIRHDVADDSGH